MSDSAAEIADVLTMSGEAYVRNKQGLRELVLFVRNVATDSLATNKLSSIDSGEVKRALSEIDRSSAEFLSLLPLVVDETKPTFAQECLMEAIWSLIGGVYTIGKHTQISRNSAKYLSRQQSSSARAVKADADRKRAERLRTAITAEAAAQNITLAVSIPFADRVRAGVRERLGLAQSQDEWPSAKTIKDMAKRMKARRTGLSVRAS